MLVKRQSDHRAVCLPTGKTVEAEDNSGYCLLIPPLRPTQARRVPAVKRLLIAACLSAAFAPAASADNWPQWRGPKNDGHSAEKGLPTEWGPEKNVVWKLKMPGISAATPCVWDNRIFVTSTDGDAIVLLCVGTDGKEKWKQKLSDTGAKRYRNPSGAEVSDSTPSCSTDGSHVWACAANGSLACFTIDGKPVWKTDLQKYGRYQIQFGCHWTPALYKGRLYLQVMHRGVQKVVCLDATTGDEVWAVDRPGAVKVPSMVRMESPDVYASAFIWEGEGGPLVVAHGNDYTTGHKLENGEEVWRVQGLNPTTNGAWRFISNVLLNPDLIVVPSCKDGPTVAFNPVGAKGDITPESKNEIWRLPGSRTARTTPDVVAPIRVGDVLYFCQDGPFRAYDAKTGKELYRADLTRFVHRANMIAADGKIYVVAANGVTDVVQAGKEFKKLATNTLVDDSGRPETIFASPAIADGRIYLRGYGYLWAIGVK
jgi:outer membrane protein assembly factor BamB